MSTTGAEAFMAAEGQSDAIFPEDNATMFVEDLELVSHDGGKAVFVLATAISLSILFGHLLHRWRISFIPESLIVVIFGAVLGWFLPFKEANGLDFEIHTIDIKSEGILNEMLLNFFLLPMIIFEAGWSMQHRHFLAQLPSILVFAVVGTLISMTAVTGMTMATASYHGVGDLRVALAYAALISAVDPVATLATYAHLQVDLLLHTIVFGESVINDAVAIVLFKTLNNMSHREFQGASGQEIAGKICVGVVVQLAVSVGVGVGLSILYCLLMRITSLGKSGAATTLFVYFTCFVTYNFTESICGMSGIISVLFSGMMMGTYAIKQIEDESDRMMTSFLLKQMASIADMMVFLFVGIAVVYITMKGLVFGLWMMLFCVVGRGIATWPLCGLTNLIKFVSLQKRENKNYLTCRHGIMIWHAGLRGGIALVLTLQLGDWVDDANAGTSEILRNATLVVICGFLLVFGGTTEILLQTLNIPMRGEGSFEIYRNGRVAKVFTRFDNYTRSILSGKVEEAVGHTPSAHAAVVMWLKRKSQAERFASFGRVCSLTSMAPEEDESDEREEGYDDDPARPISSRASVNTCSSSGESSSSGEGNSSHG